MNKKKDKFYYKDGTISGIFNNGKILHRVDGPAVEHASGTKEWYVDGKRHRVGGPAIEYSDGDKAWWVDGKLHRVDGPAVEYTDGNKVWYVDGIFYWEQEFDKIMKEVNEMSLAMKLTDPRWWVREMGERETYLEKENNVTSPAI
jgi:uncharacterized Fe-S cluster-containing protein